MYSILSRDRLEHLCGKKFKQFFDENIDPLIQINSYQCFATRFAQTLDHVVLICIRQSILWSKICDFVLKRNEDIPDHPNKQCTLMHSLNIC